MDYIPKVSRDDVLRIVERDFPAEHRKAALEVLDAYQHADLYRMHLAFLRISEGDLQKLTDTIESHRDWRDILVAAEYREQGKIEWIKWDRLPDHEKNELIMRDWLGYWEWVGREPETR